MDTVYEPLRRWGSETGLLWGWGIRVEGRTGLRPLATAYSASYGSGLEVRRDLGTRGRQTPVTITTDGAPGFSKALDAMWPRSLRLRCWFPQMQHLHAKGPSPAWPAFKALVADRRDAPTRAEGHRRPQRVGAWKTRLRRGAIISRCRCVIANTGARRTWQSAPLRRNGDGRKACRISETRPVDLGRAQPGE
jgi:transposase-like protein